MTLPVRRLCPEATLPSYAHPDDAGMDVTSTASLVIAPGERSLVPTGLVLQTPVGYEVQVRPRSGLALKRGVTVLNAPGTIDAGYRGEVGVILINLGSEPFEIKIGDRIAQLVVAPVVHADVVKTADTDSTTRGEGGFGSTGV